jgi:hypothetical protein
VPFEQNENYVLPQLTSKKAVLAVIHEVTQAQIRGVIQPGQAKAVLYALQVALCVFNSNMPDNPPQQLAAKPKPPTLEGEPQNATADRRKKK